jgi:hypothetical protein
MPRNDFGWHTRSADTPAPGNRRLLSPLPDPESAPPKKPTIICHGDMRIERIERIGLELGTQSKSRFHVEEDDPLSAVAELRRTWTMSRQDPGSGRPRRFDRLAVPATLRLGCVLRRSARERRQRALAYCPKGFTARRDPALSSRHAGPRNRIPNRDRLRGGDRFHASDRLRRSCADRSRPIGTSGF